MDEMKNLKSPMEQELMECDCKLLNQVSASYCASRHKYSITILTSFFHSEYLASKLTEDELKRLSLYIFYGRPFLQEAHDVCKTDEEFYEYIDEYLEEIDSPITEVGFKTRPNCNDAW